MDGYVKFLQTYYETVAGLAALPAVSDGGNTYTFTLRKGLKFADAPWATAPAWDAVAISRHVAKVAASARWTGRVRSSAGLRDAAGLTMEQSPPHMATAG